MISPQVLILYDPTLSLLLATDANKTGIGAVLSHQMTCDDERLIAYTRHTVLAIQRYFKYIYARHWTLITDHKLLVQILHPEKSLPILSISLIKPATKTYKIEPVALNDHDEFDNLIFQQINQLPLTAKTKKDYCKKV